MPQHYALDPAARAGDPWSGAATTVDLGRGRHFTSRGVFQPELRQEAAGRGMPAYDLGNLSKPEAQDILRVGRGREAVIAALKALGLPPTLEGYDAWSRDTGNRPGDRLGGASDSRPIDLLSGLPQTGAAAPTRGRERTNERPGFETPGWLRALGMTVQQPSPEEIANAPGHRVRSLGDLREVLPGAAKAPGSGALRGATNDRSARARMLGPGYGLPQPDAAWRARARPTAVAPVPPAGAAAAELPRGALGGTGAPADISPGALGALPRTPAPKGALAGLPAVPPGVGAPAPTLREAGDIPSRGALADAQEPPRKGALQLYEDFQREAAGEAKSGLSKQDLWLALMQTGLGTMAAASQPGATALGSIGHGGMAGVRLARDLKRDKRSDAKIAADTAFRKTQLVMSSQNQEASLAERQRHNLELEDLRRDQLQQTRRAHEEGLSQKQLESSRRGDANASSMFTRLKGQQDAGGAGMSDAQIRAAVVKAHPNTSFAKNLRVDDAQVQYQRDLAAIKAAAESGKLDPNTARKKLAEAERELEREMRSILGR